MTAPRFHQYNWDGGREAMLRFGPEDGPTVVMALPLFEEANRTRAFGVTLLRALARRAIGSVLPDLPGQGESTTPLEQISILDMQTAYDAAVEQAGVSFRAFGVGIRSGALLDTLGLLAGRWHLAPQSGTELLRELRRIRQANTGEQLPDELWWFNGGRPPYASDPPFIVAGNRLSTDLLTELTVKVPFDEPGVARRVVRLASDPAPADRKVAGAPLWRRSEPVNDPTMAEMLAGDIAAWIATCGD